MIHLTRLVAMHALLGAAACSFDAPPAIEQEQEDSSSSGEESSGAVPDDAEGSDGDVMVSSSSDGGAVPHEESSSSTDEGDGSESGEPVSDWALGFDGDDEAVTPETSAISLPTTFTVETWVYRGDEPVHGIIIDTRPLGGSEGWVLFVGIPGDELEHQLVIGWFAEDGTTPGLEGPSLQGLSRGWHHLAVTRDAAGVTNMYVDGVQGASGMTTGGAAVQVSTLAVGRYKGGSPQGGLWFTGAVDDLHISSVARYAGDFTPSRPEVDADSELLWRFDEGAGGTAFDDVQGLALHLVGPQWVPRT